MSFGTSNSLAGLGFTFNVETAVVRLAKAGFILPETTRPWKDTSASTIVTAPDGSIYYVGGKATGAGGYGSGDVQNVKLNAAGTFVERRTIDARGSEDVTTLAVMGDNSLIALTSESGHGVVRRVDAASLSTDPASIGLGQWTPAPSLSRKTVASRWRALHMPH